MFAFMPVIMTVMMAWFPAGLVLYWLTNTLLSIAQQWKINRVVEAEAKKSLRLTFTSHHSGLAAEVARAGEAEVPRRVQAPTRALTRRPLPLRG